MKQAEVRVSRLPQPEVLPHVWTYIGYDECNYTCTPEGMRLLKDFAALGDGPYYVRAHHMLCTGNCGHGFYKWGSTNVYHEDAQGNPVYDFTVVDRILDTMLQCGVKPFFELGFMPMDLVDPARFSGSDKFGDYNRYQRELWCSPPKDYGKWHDLIAALTRHLVERYGVEELETWYFELWNEPDIFYWTGTHEEFCRLYDETEAALHGVCSTLRLGGPATTGPFRDSVHEQYLRDFFDHTKNGVNYHSGQTGTRLDFVTFHTKGGGFFFDPWAEKSCPSVQRLLDQVENGIRLMKEFGYGDLPLILSEADPDGWAAGGVGDNPNMNFRNTEYYASYVISSYLRLMEMGRASGTDVRPVAWAFLFPGERCFEGTRVFTTQGIHKAVFASMQALSRLGGNRLNAEVTQPEEQKADGLCAIASEKATSIQALVARHYDDWDEEEDCQVTVRLDGPKKDAVHAFLIDRDHGNPYAEWVRQGRPDFPAGEAFEAIKRQEGLQEVRVERPDEDTVRVTLKPHSVLLLEWN